MCVHRPFLTKWFL